MGSLGGFLKFVIGGAAGTAVGLVVGSLLAPQKGADLQEAAHNRIAEAKAAGDDAERQTEIELRQRFRQRVNDPTAFTPAASRSKGV